MQLIFTLALVIAGLLEQWPLGCRQVDLRHLAEATLEHRFARQGRDRCRDIVLRDELPLSPAHFCLCWPIYSRCGGFRDAPSVLLAELHTVPIESGLYVGQAKWPLHSTSTFASVIGKGLVTLLSVKAAPWGLREELLGLGRRRIIDALVAAWQVTIGVLVLVAEVELNFILIFFIIIYEEVFLNHRESLLLLIFWHAFDF